MKLNWISITCLFSTVAFAAILGLLGKPTEMGIMVVACAICLAFLNIDKLQRFKGAGFEAEMKKAVDDANATIEQLGNVAAMSAKATLTSLMASNFMSGTTLKTRLDLHDQIISNLREIGVSEGKIDEADEMWRRGIGIIYHRGIRHKLDDRKKSNQPNDEAKKKVLEVSEEFQNLIKFEEWQAPSSSEMKAFIGRKGIMDQEIVDLIDDYSHFETTGNIKRRELFVELLICD